MNKTEFIQLIQHPEKPQSGHISALKQVLSDFPYFSNAQVLLAKALHNEQHYEYEKFLKQTALAVPDREVLYHYIHNLEKHWLSAVTPIATVSSAPVKPIEEPTITEQVTELIIEEPSTIEEIPIVEEIMETPELTAETFTPTEAEVDAEIVQSMDEIAADLAIEELLSEQHIVLESEIVTTESSITTEEPEATTEEVTETIDDNGEHSFLDWLKIKSGRPQETPRPPLESEKIEEIKQEESPLTINQEVTPPTPAAPANLPEVTKEDIEKAVAKSNVNDFHGILDKFIRENPSISRPKAEFFNPVNMARQSVEEDEELVTETLANLYYKQGNLKKAIRAYEKLCLKYPSKITYFANLIQKIKTELKD